MRSRWLGFVLAALAMALSVWAYPRLPPTIPSHWNLDGVVDGYSSRLAGTLIIPLGMLGLRLALAFLPKIDPLRANYERFSDTYWLFVNAILLFVAFMHAVVLANGLGFTVNPSTLIPIALGILFILLGNVMTRLAPNWFIGIRTPWTLSDEYVWRKTHRLGGWLMVIGGFVILVVSLVARPIAVKFSIAVLAVLSGVSIVYSYVLWRRRPHDPSR